MKIGLLTSGGDCPGLNAVMRQCTGQDRWTYDPAMLDAVGIFRLEVESLTCKEHL